MSLLANPTLPLALCAVGCILGVIASACVSERRASALISWLGAPTGAALLWAASLGLGGRPFDLKLWSLPMVTLHLALSPLGSFILIVTALVYIPVSLFSSSYIIRYTGRYSLRAFAAAYFALFLSITIVVLAHDLVSFFLAWEAVAIISFLLVSFEHRERESVLAGFWMFAIGEAGTLAALAGWLIIDRGSGLDFSNLALAAPQLGLSFRWVVFLLTFFGFATKAGLIPVNPWLPRAHPVAPGNVSALLSAVILNLGVYGMILTLLWLGDTTTPAMGATMLAVGAITAIIGILYAAIDDDLKRLLAFSSIENIGLIIVGIGAAVVFAASGLKSIVILAQVAALYQLLNHSIAKALLFIAAATVDARAGTRDMNRLGGLLRALPWTGAAFLVGALSLAALPPFGGFASEWLLLQTLLRSVELDSTALRIVFALVGSLVALTAALSVTCFVKAFAMTFLGLPRVARSNLSEVRPGARTPFVILAIGVVLLGVLPTYTIPVVGRAMNSSQAADNLLVPPFFQPLNPNRSSALPPQFVADFHNLGAGIGQGVIPGRGLVVMMRGGPSNPVVFAMSTTYLVVVLALLLGLTYAVFGLYRRRVSRGAVWDGALPRLLPELTYTAAGFSNPIRVVFEGVFASSVEESREAVAAHLRTAIRLVRRETYFADRVFVQPVVRAALAIARALASMHHGRLNAYVGYVLGALVLTLTLALAMTSGTRPH